MKVTRWLEFSLILLLSACITPASAPVQVGSPSLTEALEVVPVGIPSEYIPPPGNCRVWYRDMPPDKQPQPERCLEVREVPPGAWLVYGGAIVKTYRIEEYDPQNPGIVNTVNYFELESGRFLRQEKIRGRETP